MSGNNAAAQRERERQQREREQQQQRERQQREREAATARERQAAETARAKAEAQKRIDAAKAKETPAAAPQTQGPLAPGVTSIPGNAALSIEGANASRQSSKPTTIKEADSLRDALRIAGANGNIGGGELRKITNQFDVDEAKAIRALDKVNSGLADRGKDLQIGLGSNAVNNLTKTGNTFTSGIFRESQFGDGKIGSAVQNYVNASNPTGGNTGKFNSPSSTFEIPSNRQERSVAQSAAGLIPLQPGGAYQINAKGGYSPKVSNSAFSNPVPKASSVLPETTPTTPAGIGATTDTTPAANPIEPLPDEPIMPSMQSANNAALNGNAGGFRAKKSSWRTSGKNSKGTNNLKINNTSGVGLNIRG